MESPFLSAQKLERQLGYHLTRIDRDNFTAQQLSVLDALHRNMTDARLDIRDYELSETRAEQLNNATEASKRLTSVSAGLLQASEYNVFGAADVAQFSAQVEQISSKLV